MKDNEKKAASPEGATETFNPESLQKTPQGGQLPPPSLESVREWVRRDAHATLAFLNVLVSRPEILRSVADAMYEDFVIRNGKPNVDL